ncbi:MAG: TIGR02147 family protein [Fibrobacter sp.]|nr:TIGR02147 family protein [Fibrobacter sp.]
MHYIFDFVDYRDYLNSVFEYKKKLNPGFSHRMLARVLGLKASGHMLFVMQGKRKLTYELTQKIAVWLKLGKKETEYFFVLVNYCNAKNADEKKGCYDELLRLKRKDCKVVETDQCRFYEKWYYSAIRSALDIVDFRDDYNMLASALCPPITVSQAREAIEVLKEDGFIRENCSGYFKPSDTLITSGNNWKSAAIENLRFEFLDLGRESLTRFEPQKRDASFLTLSLSQKSFDSVKGKIQNLRAEILNMAQNEKSPDRVIQCNITLFPMFITEKP